MCTTYIGHKIAETLRNTHNEDADTYLIRLNPAAKHKTRGNAAVAIHTTAPQNTAFNTAKQLVEKHSHPEDTQTNPGIVCTDTEPNTTTPALNTLGEFTERALTEFIDISEAVDLIEQYNLTSHKIGNGRGRIGALAAIAAHTTFTDWTFETITYRAKPNWGEKRVVDWDAIATAHDELYPRIWDNYDPVTGQGVCVPHTPCPVLLGVRGDDERAVKTAASKITDTGNTERATGQETFKSNQGTDVQFIDACVSDTTANKSYTLTGTVATSPETIEGGHVFTTLTCDSPDCTCDENIEIVAFEPTKRFRDIIRRLQKGDTVTVYGEITDGTLKLEKLRVTELKTTTKTNPYCDDCDKSMSSMGANQGYRCSSCRNTQPEKVTVPLHRELVSGRMYEVPPTARRHLTKPLIRKLTT
jgi:tRNA(Ile2)-agmatinylcytidine synthase